MIGLSACFAFRGTSFIIEATSDHWFEGFCVRSNPEDRRVAKLRQIRQLLLLRFAVWMLDHGFDLRVDGDEVRVVVFSIEHREEVLKMAKLWVHEVLHEEGRRIQTKKKPERRESLGEMAGRVLGVDILHGSKRIKAKGKKR